MLARSHRHLQCSVLPILRNRPNLGFAPLARRVLGFHPFIRIDPLFVGLWKQRTRWRKPCLPPSIGILEFEPFSRQVDPGTWLKPGAWGCKTKERSNTKAPRFLPSPMGSAGPLLKNARTPSNLRWHSVGFARF
jgi:hypothetical protein